MPDQDDPAPPPAVAATTEETAVVPHLVETPSAATTDDNVLAEEEEVPAPSGGGLFLVGHPLVQVKLTRLRDAATTPTEFRRVLRELAALLFFILTDDLAVLDESVQTPLAECHGYTLARPLVFAPVLRAGLGLLEGLHDLAPEAEVAHIGIYRDEKTLAAHRYYLRTPASGLSEAEVIVLDPMLATGHTAVEAVSALKAAGAQFVRFLCVVSCAEGIEALQTAHPDVAIYTASVDSGLNEHGYIVPGLGDAGDRYFGT